MEQQPTIDEWISALQQRDEYLKEKWRTGDRTNLAFCPDTGSVQEVTGTSFALSTLWINLSGGGWPLPLFVQCWVCTDSTFDGVPVTTIAVERTC